MRVPGSLFRLDARIIRGFRAPHSSVGICVGVIIFCMFSLAGACCCHGSEAIRSRSFNGVTATFTMVNHVIRIGENLKVIAIYRNTARRPVNFRFAHLDEDMELYLKGDTKRIIGGFTGEAPYREVTLAPGETFRFEDSINMKGWPKLQPGEYEIRFAYHLGLLSDDSLIKHYQAIYPHDHYLVPWSDHRYAFRLVK